MTLDDFHNLTRERIPTAEEFFAFVRSQGWSIRKTETAAALRATPTDPVALALAKMLRREPYRTNVLELAMRAQPDIPKESRPDSISGAVESRGEFSGQR